MSERPAYASHPAPLDRARRLVALLLGALTLAACASGGPSRADELGLGSAADFDAKVRNVERKTPEELGALLIELDALIQSWNSHKLGLADSDARKRRVIESDLQRVARQRFDDLLDTVIQGAPRGRAIAAAALGFSHSDTAIDPLLEAAESEDLNVKDNALFALGILGSPAVPTAPLLRQLVSGAEPKTRINAAFALQRTLAAGEPSAETVADATAALLDAIHDPEAGVRVQVATTLRLLEAPEAVDALGDRLYDDEELSALASARALVDIGLAHGELQGTAARHLYNAYAKARVNRQGLLQVEMMRLAGRNFGDRDEDWRDWAYRLP